MFVQSGTHNADRFVEQEGAVVAREMQLSPFVMHRFGVWVELEGDVLDDDSATVISPAQTASLASRFEAKTPALERN